MILTIKQKLIKILNTVLFPVVKIYWRVFKPETNGVKIIVENKGKFLFIKNTYGYKSWTFPGGKIEKGEKSKKAARRELLEETGLETIDIKFVDKIVSTSEGKTDNIYIYYTKSDTRNFSLDEIEIVDGAWFDANSLPKLGPVTRKIFETFQSSM